MGERKKKGRKEGRKEGRREGEGRKEGRKEGICLWNQPQTQAHLFARYPSLPDLFFDTPALTTQTQNTGVRWSSFIH
jgi:hypothetical protein